MDVHQNGFGLVELTPDVMSVTYHQLDVTGPANRSRPTVRFDSVPEDPQPTITRF